MQYLPLFSLSEKYILSRDQFEKSTSRKIDTFVRKVMWLSVLPQEAFIRNPLNETVTPALPNQCIRHLPLPCLSAVTRSRLEARESGLSKRWLVGKGRPDSSPRVLWARVPRGVSAYNYVRPENSLSSSWQRGFQQKQQAQPCSGGFQMEGCCQSSRCIVKVDCHGM